MARDKDISAARKTFWRLESKLIICSTVYPSIFLLYSLAQESCPQFALPKTLNIDSRLISYYISLF